MLRYRDANTTDYIKYLMLHERKVHQTIHQNARKLPVNHKYWNYEKYSESTIITQQENQENYMQSLRY